jgi:phytoene desaturase
MSLRIGVIGAGFGGLAASCVLAARGHNVTLFERNAQSGGVAAQFESHGFRFDTGPAVLAAPRFLARIFEEAGRKLDDRIKLIRLDPQERAFFDDGSSLDLTDAEPARAFLAETAKLQRARERFVFRRTVETPRDLFERDFVQPPLADLLALRPGRSVASLARRTVADPRWRRMLESLTRDSGTPPEEAPALLAGAAHLQLHEGVFHPVGGMRAVAAALEKLLLELGGEIRFSTAIEKIEHVAGVAVGLRTQAGVTLQFDAVLSNANVVRTMQDLVGRDLDREPSCSAVVLCLGLDQRYEHLAHRNVLFGSDAGDEPASDPTCYVTAPSRVEPDTAPDGGEAMQVLVQVPYLRPHHDWQAMWPAYRGVILDKLKRAGGMPDLEARIVVEHHRTPQDFHDRYGLQNGAVYGLASNGTPGLFKPGNRARQLAGLYLAGGSVHPGAGVPMALLSGWIAADTLDRDGRSGRLRV